MTRDQAIEVARRHAHADGRSYYSEGFMPHEWVIRAILEASRGVHQATAERPAARVEPTTDTGEVRRDWDRPGYDIDPLFAAAHYQDGRDLVVGQRPGDGMVGTP